MVRSKNKIVIFGLVVICSLVFTHDAHAYIDPGTGSYVIQVLIAFLIGAGFVIRMFWNSIKSFFVKLLAKNKK